MLLTETMTTVPNEKGVNTIVYIHRGYTGRLKCGHQVHLDLWGPAGLVTMRNTKLLGMRLVCKVSTSC